MSSISIYTSISVTQSTQICFVYKWTQLSTGKWYIDSHTSKSAHPNDGYTCSSKIVKPMIKECLEDWTREILEIGTKDDMLLLEHELLKCLNAAYSDYSYNRNNGGGTFSTAGMRSSNFGKITSNETRLKISKANLGKIHKKERIVSEATKEKQRIAASGKILSEETKEKIRTANIGKKLSKETCDKMSKSMKNRIVSKEWGDKISKSKRGIKMSTIICPHCNKSGGNSLMKRYHFDNCKIRPHIEV